MKMGLIILLVLAYVAGQCVFIYNNDAKMKTKCKGKSFADVCGILLTQVWENHKFWYKDSQLEDIVEEVKHDGSQLIEEASKEGSELVQDLKQEAKKVATKAKAKVEEVQKKAKAKAKEVKNAEEVTKVATKEKDKKSTSKAAAKKK